MNISIPGRVLFLFSLMLAFFSCQSDPDAILGNDMHANDSLQAHYDTAFQIEAFSVSDDSIILQNASTVLLGTSYSPVFGSSTYNLVVQLLTLRTSDDAYSSGSLDYSRIDSVILYLPYSRSFPTHNRMDGRALTLSIHELEEDLVDGVGYDSAYSSNYQVRYNQSRPIAGPVTVYPRPYDTVYDSVSGSLLIAPLKISLNHDFGRMLLDKVKSMSESEGLDLEACPKYFKGIYIKVQPCTREEESIVFSVSNLFAEGAYLNVYFDGMGDQTSYQSFVLGPTRFTQVIRDRTVSTDPLYKAQMEKPFDTVSGRERLYVEGSGGSRIRFRLPGFEEVVSGKVVLNQAVLVLENPDAGQSPDIGVPEQLVCFRYLNRGQMEELPQESNAGGYYNESSGQYRINITRYLQQILYQGTVDPENYKRFWNYIDVAPSSDERYEHPVRVVLNGPGTEKGNMRLEVIYTVINE